MTDYIPVDCGIHSELELAVMRGMPVDLCWRDTDGVPHRDTVTATDLRSVNHEEFLYVTGSRGERLAIRLDRIDTFSTR